MTKYAKYISERRIQYAPLNYTREDGTKIFNFNTNVDVMLDYGFKPVYSVDRPSDDRRFDIKYVEEEDCINEEVVFLETEEEAKKRKEQAEIERVMRLSCTKRDFAILIEDKLGISYRDRVLPIIKADSRAELEWELCEKLYRFNPALDNIGKVIGVSHEQIDLIFRVANGELGDFVLSKEETEEEHLEETEEE